MSSDVDTATDPHFGKGDYIVQKSCQTGSSTWMADDTHVEADGHHLRLLRSFRIEHVESVFEKREVVIGVANTPRANFESLLVRL